MSTLSLLVAYVAAVTLLVSAMVALLFYLCWRLHLAFWSPRLGNSPAYAELEEHTLPDGGVIALRRIRGGASPEATAASARVPVLLIHGLAMNHRCFDLDETSLARHLAREGFDVWLLTLRSGRSYLSPFGPRHCDFASMVAHDLPFAVDAVRARTGKPQVDVAGLSMGGMLLYAGLGRSLAQDKVRRVIVFGSPGKIRALGPISLSRFLPARLALGVPMRAWLRTVAFAPRLVPRLLWRRLYNPANLEAPFERRMLWNVWENIPGRLGHDFVSWSAAGGAITVDHTPVLAGLAHVDVPALFFAGSVDWLAPVTCVRAAYDAWGSALPMVDKQFVVMGRETSGASCDYGHCDLILGHNAAREVFEPAVAFLRADERYHGVQHSTPAPKLDAPVAPLARQA